ncbi:RagB/SusD family nutrient uptake outer membrane protein [Pedobacter nyackensis]|uniref:Starch-binding associating with outer membrane n=1 Tax=Pedobacter nyackensis TaxID=475255 RepID=A0A1W2E138_9SPHI|nr:RagB/SusD family nutrient uptake outer membrane protein [Pedobacter nyackensis]SMD03490.1 Starch-binding associating with outer membrane [Pedobacter nyackensis]
MIKKYKDILKKSVLFLALSTAIVGCVNKDEFFELKDRGGIDAAIWSTEGAIEMHLRETYDMSTPRFPHQDTYDRYPIHLASDENYFSGNDTWAKAALGVQGVLANNDVRFVGNKYQGSTFGDNRYFDIARCNNGIVNIPLGTLSDALKKRFVGQYYALRALNYFELVKVYGGVPLVLTPQSPGTLDVGGRAKAKECFDQILKDLDLAKENLQNITWGDSDGRGRISTEIVACLRARVLLYWASPQFNPGNDLSRWQTALQANKEAYDLCKANGRKLMSNYSDIFLTEGLVNTEAVFVRTYSATVERRGHNTENKVRPVTEGGSANNAFIPTLILLNAYPMKDGNPISTVGGNAKYTYDATMFWQNRDPRFEATFAYNGSVWPLSGKAGRKQWNYVNAAGETANYGVYSKKFSNASIASGAVNYTNNLGGSGMDWVEIRFAEVMMNYAECANETGDLSTAKNLIREIRQRAGIEAGNGGNDYGLGAISSSSQMRELLVNERFIEFSFESKRNADLRRLRRWHTLTGTIQTIRIELQRSGDKAILESAIPTNPTMLRRDTLDYNKKSTYNYFFKNAVLTPSGISAFSIPEYHYFYTFHNDFMYSSALLLPTIGWAGGSFDPLN